MFMTTAGAGVGTTLGYGTAVGAGTLAGAGAGTTHGDGTAGAGEALVGAGMPAGAGADIGTVRSLEEDITAEITRASRADVGIPIYLELPSLRAPTEDMLMDLDIIVAAPTEPLVEAITWQVAVPVATVIAPMCGER